PLSGLRARHSDAPRKLDGMGNGLLEGLRAATQPTLVKRRPTVASRILPPLRARLRSQVGAGSRLRTGARGCTRGANVTASCSCARAGDQARLAPATGS